MKKQRKEEKVKTKLSIIWDNIVLFFGQYCPTDKYILISTASRSLYYNPLVKRFSARASHSGEKDLKEGDFLRKGKRIEILGFVLQAVLTRYGLRPPLSKNFTLIRFLR